jgi:hypothetical protein
VCEWGPHKFLGIFQCLGSVRWKIKLYPNFTQGSWVKILVLNSSTEVVIVIGGGPGRKGHAWIWFASWGHARIMRGDAAINRVEQVRKSHACWAWNILYRPGSVATLETLQTTDYIPRRQWRWRYGAQSCQRPCFSHCWACRAWLARRAGSIGERT